MKGNEVELMQRSWMSAIGSKVSTDNLLDAKSLMKLVEMPATKSQLDSLKGTQPNAATDPAYGDWEHLIRGICKVLTTITNDFLTVEMPEDDGDDTALLSGTSNVGKSC